MIGSDAMERLYKAVARGTGFGWLWISFNDGRYILCWLAAKDARIDHAVDEHELMRLRVGGQIDDLGTQIGQTMKEKYRRGTKRELYEIDP